MKGTIVVPLKYVPKHLSKEDHKKQSSMLKKSREMYKAEKYITREKLSSFKPKPSAHVKKAKEIYKVDKITPNRELSKKTGCSVKALEHIVRKGRGAYYSSGSRPNQTAQSWGIARLASSITAGKSAIVDYHILEKGCNHAKTAYKLAQKAKITKIRKPNHIPI